MAEELQMTVSEFVGLVNQTLNAAYPYVTVVGELADFRVSKNRWVYFDLKDESSLIRCFGTVYHLPGPLENGMLVKVSGSPRLHPVYGFSFNIQTIRPSGEGAIQKAANLLEAKLMAEGLFDRQRKRALPYPPSHIGLITSADSAAYSDFMKVLNNRWRGITVSFMDVQVQGELAPVQVAQAIRSFNVLTEPPDVLVIIRGGGSAEDLQPFSTEQVTRSVAASRIPTLVAIGHERDVSLAELAADMRASTPSNAAEILVPERQQILSDLRASRRSLDGLLLQTLSQAKGYLDQGAADLHGSIRRVLHRCRQDTNLKKQLLTLLNPRAPLKRGYALIFKDKKVMRQVHGLVTDDIVEVTMRDGFFKARVGTLKENL